MKNKELSAINDLLDINENQQTITISKFNRWQVKENYYNSTNLNSLANLLNIDVSLPKVHNGQSNYTQASTDLSKLSKQLIPGTINHKQSLNYKSIQETPKTINLIKQQDHKHYFRPKKEIQDAHSLHKLPVQKKQLIRLSKIVLPSLKNMDHPIKYDGKQKLEIQFKSQSLQRSVDQIEKQIIKLQNIQKNYLVTQISELTTAPYIPVLDRSLDCTPNVQRDVWLHVHTHQIRGMRDMQFLPTLDDNTIKNRNNKFFLN